MSVSFNLNLFGVELVEKLARFKVELERDYPEIVLEQNETEFVIRKASSLSFEALKKSLEQLNTSGWQAKAFEGEMRFKLIPLFGAALSGQDFKK